MAEKDDSFLWQNATEVTDKSLLNCITTEQLNISTVYFYPHLQVTTMGDLHSITPSSEVKSVMKIRK